MRRLLVGLCALVLAAATDVAVAAGPSGGDATRQCYTAAANAPDPRAALPCKLADGTVDQAGADCRLADDADNRCSAIDGRDISAAEVRAYRASWVHRALTLQRALTSYAPLIEEQLPHTHNSFNASAYSVPVDGSRPSYYPTLTNQDPNQVYSLTDQLDMDVRVIELDLHWVPSPYAPADGSTHGYWVTLCHGDGQQVPGQQTYVHVGCSDDRPAQDGFAEVRRWIDTHPGQFVYIYLENQLYPQQPLATQQQGVDVAASLLDKAFGDIAYRPARTTNGDCTDIPYTTVTTAQMLASGKRVLLLGNCGVDSASTAPTWSGLVFQRGSGKWDESGDPASYTSADCVKDQSTRARDRVFRREYEDSTFVSAATGDGPHALMSPEDVATMTRCGVNIIGFDQLRPQDGRLAALVWSWAQNEPARGSCAVQGRDGRFHATGCRGKLPAACQSPDGTWHVTNTAVERRQAASECPLEFPASSFSVPLNGFRNDQLRLAHGAVGDVWLDYANVDGVWKAFTAAARTDRASRGRSAPHGPRGHGHRPPPRNASLD